MDVKGDRSDCDGLPGKKQHAGKAQAAPLLEDALFLKSFREKAALRRASSGSPRSFAMPALRDGPVMKMVSSRGNVRPRHLMRLMLLKGMIDCPDLSTQMSIGKLYHYQKQRQLLLMEKIRLEKSVLTEELKQHLENL